MRELDVHDVFMLAWLLFDGELLVSSPSARVCVRSHCAQCPPAVSYCCYFPLVRKIAASLVLSSSVETHQVMRLSLYSFLSRLLCLVVLVRFIHSLKLSRMTHTKSCALRSGSTIADEVPVLQSIQRLYRLH